MIGTLEQVYRDMKAGVYDFTNNGECSGCGQCCSNFLPISSKEVKEIHRYIRKHRITEQKHFIPTADGLQFDLTCPFRSDREHKCLIYPVRPAICRDFKCDNTAKGIKANKDLYHGRFGMVEMREEFYGNGGKYDGVHK